ncbi:hypothetical protein [Cypionkella sp.]|uniref:hypothetical protein n=1 Tax=Cypionkella sp. TaxID=2811411 RepID=UPI00261311DC|nr:hypothetical protein [Cypionkella sp.]MDB5663548.1 hypothetical protein [Cypionkella sp.]
MYRYEAVWSFLYHESDLCWIDSFRSASEVDDMTAQHSPEQLLALLQGSLRDIPTFGFNEVDLSDGSQRWLGRVDSILEASGKILASISFRVARDNIGSPRFKRDQLLQPLYDVLSDLELRVPAALQGSFIPPGDTWNGYAALVQLVQRDCTSLLIVDPYLSADVFLNFTAHTRAANGTRLLSLQIAQYHAGLLTAAQRWNADPISSQHPVEARYAPARSLHDRHIIIDGREVWNISQSMKDIAKSSAASVTRNSTDLSDAKAQHYEDLWNQSTPLF